MATFCLVFLCWASLKLAKAPEPRCLMKRKSSSLEAMAGSSRALELIYSKPKSPLTWEKGLELRVGNEVATRVLP